MAAADLSTASWPASSLQVAFTRFAARDGAE